MDAAQTIRDAVAKVSALRAITAATEGLSDATRDVKRFQARRFAGTYCDLLDSPAYAGATRFFLEELYSEKDYTQRDAQFSRIAGALQRFFPEQVAATAVAMAELHALTEELDHEMALAWLQATAPRPQSKLESTRYIGAWLQVCRPADRERQLSVVMQVGTELDRLTRKSGLRFTLRMMRRPAEVAGLGALQSFLEAGFDTFAAMAGKGRVAQEFLALIRERETAWLEKLSFGDAVASATELTACLTKAR